MNLIYNIIGDFMKHCIIVKWNEDVDKKNILIPIKELYSGALDIPGISGVTFIA